MDKKIAKNDIINIIKTFLIIIIPLIIAYFLLFNYSFKLELEKQKELIVNEQTQRSNTVIYVVQDLLNEVESDLFVIKNADEMARYIKNSSQSNLKEVENLFLRIAYSKKNFDQIRLINSEGMETIRVNNSESFINLVESKDLQDKSKRYYFSATKELADGDVYVTPMDLNMENGELEVPYKPVIRISTPLYNNENEFSGILLINYLGSDLLEILNEQFGDSEYDFVNHYLVDESGYYLFNEDEEKTFSFMFDDGYSLKNDYPSLWREIDNSNKGSIEIEGSELCYISLNPLENLKAAATEYKWVIVSEFAMDELMINNDNIILGLDLINIIVLFILIIAVFVITTIVYFKRKDKRQLNITNRIAENTNDATVITDSDTKIIYINKAFERVTGYSEDEVIGKRMNYLKSGMHDKEFYKKMWNSINEKGSWEGELWDKKKDGILYPRKLNIMSVKNKYGKVERYVGIFTDLTKIKESEKLNKIENYNLESGLPNEKLLKELLDIQAINVKKELTIICFELNNYNDLITNVELDYQDYLNVLIDEIKKEISKEDVIAQLSKTIFVIGLLNDVECETISDKLFKINKKTIKVEGEDFLVDVKAGITSYPEDGKSAEELINNANIALSEAKKDSLSRYIHFKPEFKEKILEEMEMSILLSKAVASKELDVFYQPQVSCCDGEVIGAEALMRWNSKELGNVSPNVFIPLAEKNGYIIDLGYWIIDRVFRDYLIIKDKVKDEFKLSINVSPLQFKDEKLIDCFIDLSKKHGIDLENFEIEITENLFLEDLETMNNKLKKFNELGITVAIDDFGTGFSSLSYIKNLNINKLKIDRSFIKDYPDIDDGGMAKVITNIGKELKLEVITEGTETEDQVAYSREIGCNSIQGYYYSKPLNLENFMEYLDLNNCV